MIRGRLDGKIAIVTSAGSGLGEAIARKFAREGARVVVNGVVESSVNAVVDGIRAKGGEAIAFVGNISEESGAAACVQCAVDEWGGLDILVNNAGAFLVTAPVEEFPVEPFDELVTKNIRSVYLMTKYAMPHLQTRAGNIISTGSEAGILGFANNAAYGGTKGFIHAFMKGVATEGSKYGVRANCVCPGAINPAWARSGSGESSTKATLAATPREGTHTPEQIADVFAFLASDLASFVTGALWSVDDATSWNAEVGNRNAE